MLSAFTTGVGFTVMVKDNGVPLHELEKGVTVIIAVTGRLPVLMPANGAMPVVELLAAERPIDAFVFVHT